MNSLYGGAYQCIFFISTVLTSNNSDYHSDLVLLQPLPFGPVVRQASGQFTRLLFSPRYRSNLEPRSLGSSYQTLAIKP